MNWDGKNTHCLFFLGIGDWPSLRGRPGPRFGGVHLVAFNRETDAVPAVATPPGICGV